MGPLFDPRELRYPANWLSLLRLALVVPTVRTLWQDDGERRALLIIALGMATDAVDGPLARARGEVSDLGKLLDPIADKLTLDSVAVAMSLRRGLPWWITALLLGRDAAILAGGTVILRRSAQITPAMAAGKATTATLTGALLLYLLDIQPWGRRALNLALVPLAASVAQYSWRFRRWHRAGNVERGGIVEAARTQ